MKLARWLGLWSVFYVVIPSVVVLFAAVCCHHQADATPITPPELSPKGLVSPSFDLTYDAGQCDCWFDYDTGGLSCECVNETYEEAAPEAECAPKHSDWYEPLCVISL